MGNTFVPTGLFPETHHPRLLQTVSHLLFFLRPTFQLMQFNARCADFKDADEIRLFCLQKKILKDSSFLAPFLTRLTNFMIFQKG